MKKGNLKKPLYSCVLLPVWLFWLLVLLVCGLASFKEAPVQVERQEHPLRVETTKVEAVSVPVFISGHGEARALATVTIAPEIAGRVMTVHGNAKPGGIIAAGETLFSLDRRNFVAAQAEAAATVRQLEQGIIRLQRQSDTDKDRLQTLARNSQLAREEFQRLKALLEEDQVGTQSGVMYFS